jgi:glycosyltransferase involved in cell wall biosynthesis
MNTPLVSIVIPFYNSAAFLEDAIHSCVSQTYRNLEIIAVDDGSTDESAILFTELMKSHQDIRYKLLSHPFGENHGVAASRVLAFKHASGQFITLIDSDDTYQRSKITKQLECFELYKSVVVCHTAVHIIGDNINQAELITREAFFGSSPRSPYRFSRQKDFLLRLRICNSSAMIRTSALRKIFYPMSMSNANEDWLLWVLLSRVGLFVQLPEKLTNYSILPSSLSSSAFADSSKQRLLRIEFLVLVLVYTFPSLTSLRSCVFLLRTLAGLAWNYDHQKVSLSRQENDP